MNLDFVVILILDSPRENKFFFNINRSLEVFLETCLQLPVGFWWSTSVILSSEFKYGPIIKARMQCYRFFLIGLRSFSLIPTKLRVTRAITFLNILRPCVDHRRLRSCTKIKFRARDDRLLRNQCEILNTFNVVPSSSSYQLTRNSYVSVENHIRPKRRQRDTTRCRCSRRDIEEQKLQLGSYNGRLLKKGSATSSLMMMVYTCLLAGPDKLDIFSDCGLIGSSIDATATFSCVAC